MKKLNTRKSLIIIIASAAVVLAVITSVLVIRLGTPVPMTTDGKAVKEPYSMLVDGKEVMLVTSKRAGLDALQEAVEMYTPEGTIKKTVTYDKTVSFRKKKIVPFKKLRKVLNKNEVYHTIIEKNMSSDPLFVATIVSVKNKRKKVAPKVRFKYNELMDLFEYEVKSEGKSGIQSVRYEWVSENGKIVSKEKKETTMVQEPERAVVVTGYDNAPKNLKWSDYDKYQKQVEEEYGDAKIGDKMVNYGKKFLGNPYKYGGTSLTNGIDCVQFIRAIYRKYGINLPGKRSALATVGKGVSAKDARPGDIVYYGNHVAMYIGNGKVIHAQHKGISISNMNYRKYKTIRRVKKK